MTHLEQEIYAQPDVIEELLTKEEKNSPQIAQAIREFDPAFVMIAARGTSDNAARYAQYVLGIQLGLPVALATPSVHTLYGTKPNLKPALVIGISQSGQSQDIRQVVANAKSQGALTLSITNDPASPLSELAQHNIDLHAGEELSVAATKTYTAQLTAIALLAHTLAPQSDLHQLPAYGQNTLEQSASIVDWVSRYRYADHIAVIGRGYNYCTAFEISLKIKELCYITGEEYSEADFRHGPIAVIREGFPVIVIAPQGKPLPLLLDLLDKLHDKKAECLVVSNHAVVLNKAHYSMPIATNVPEWLSPICTVMPGQLFALHLAQNKGHSIDNPVGLTKVTDTR
jgi:glucosamine--fructose-6-phosphate aminotransferase (isomerizing)